MGLTLAIDYRMTVYDDDDTTVLTPRAGAPHSDSFIISTGTWGTAKPYLFHPQGRRGRLDMLTGKTDTGGITIKMVDAKISTGNAQRWGTAFFGDADNISQMMGLKVLIEERVSENGGTPTTSDYFTGRIDDARVGPRKNELTFKIRDMADDLNYTIFTGMLLGETNQYVMKAPPEMNSGEAAYVSYGNRPALAPLGIPDRTAYLGGTENYGGFITQRWMKGTWQVDSEGNGYIELDREWTPYQLRIIDSSWPGVSGNPRFFGRGLRDNPYLRVRVRRDTGSTFGDFNWGCRSVEPASDWLEAFQNAMADLRLESGQTEGELLRVPLLELDTADGDYKAFSDFTTNDVVYCYVYSIANPTEESPIYIGEVHPVDLLKDILDGKWGPINIDGTARRTFPYDSTSFTSLADDDTIPLSRWIIEEPAKLNEWIEENIFKPYQIGYRLNGSGEMVIFRTTKPTSDTVSGIATINDDDISTESGSGWNQNKKNALTLLTYKAYEEVGPLANITGGGSRLAQAISAALEQMGFLPPQYRVPVASAENSITYLMADADQLKTKGVQKHEVKLAGLHTGFQRFHVNAFGVQITWAERARAWADRHKESIKALFSYGPIQYGVTCLRTSATSGCYPGDWRFLATPDQIDPANVQRGGTRAAICLERAERGLLIDFTFLDGGPNASSTAPTINALAAGTNTKHQVNVPINYGAFSKQERVVIEYALTDTGTGTRPAEGSEAWLYAFTHTDVPGSGVVTKTISSLPSNTRVWVRGRNEPAYVHQGLPSAWAFPSGAGYIDTTAYTAPSALAIDTTSFGGGVVAITVTLGNTDTNTILALGAGSCPAGSYERIKMLAPGDNRYILAGTDVSTTYCLQAYSEDAYGGMSSKITQQFTTAATKKTAPVMADVAIVFTR